MILITKLTFTELQSNYTSNYTKVEVIEIEKGSINVNCNSNKKYKT